MSPSKWFRRSLQLNHLLRGREAEIPFPFTLFFSSLAQGEVETRSEIFENCLLVNPKLISTLVLGPSSNKESSQRHWNQTHNNT
jgi:hypothetical protein